MSLTLDPIRMIEAARLRWHTRGRAPVEGRRLRYDACTAIPMTVLAMLKEFEADATSRYFHCIQDENLAIVRPLIAEGERIANGDYEPFTLDSEAWADWLKRVAEILPGLWD